MKNKSKILYAIKIITAAGLIIFLTVYVDYKEIIRLISTADIFIILMVLLLTILNLFLQFQKWRLVCNRQLGVNNNMKILKSLFVGIGAGIFTPMKFGEYISRGILFEDKRMVDVAFATFIDKGITLLIGFIIGLILFNIFMIEKDYVSTEEIINFYLIIFLVAALIITVTIIIRGRLKELVKYVVPKEHRLRIKEYFFTLKSIEGNFIPKIIAIALIFHLTFTSQFALLIYSFTGVFDFLLYFYIANLILFVKIVIPPVAFGEIGVREGAAVYFTQSFAIAPAIGFSASLIIFFFNFILPSFAGLYFLSKR
ncbi:MAG: flippase-like domain-containing protein [Melioribacteraceae bacterium]|nr:flippase-like domain-containing protein [Melioribacteraceae bacterium]